MLGRGKRAASFISQVLYCEPFGKNTPSLYLIQMFTYLWLFPGLELPSLTVTRSFMPSPQWSASKQLENGCGATARELPLHRG